MCWRHYLAILEFPYALLTLARNLVTVATHGHSTSSKDIGVGDGVSL
jgi:hypothetical protein